MTEVVDSAMNNLIPAQIFTGHGSADFAKNRRQFTDNGVIFGVNPAGPVDHDVPVIKFAAIDGKLLAVLFGYACHNTAMNTYQINGDYAGFAQAELEKEYPGTIAMFMEGCGADLLEKPFPIEALLGRVLDRLCASLQPNSDNASASVGGVS